MESPVFSLPVATTAFSTAISAEVQFSSFMLILELKFGAGEFDAMKPKNLSLNNNLK